MALCRMKVSGGTPPPAAGSFPCLPYPYATGACPSWAIFAALRARKEAGVGMEGIPGLNQSGPKMAHESDPVRYVAYS
jgi:hypothetical protein